MQQLGISEISVWRAIRAMKAVGLLAREGGDKGGKWIAKRTFQVVEIRGVEPLTFSMPLRRSTN